MIFFCLVFGSAVVGYTGWSAVGLVSSIPAGTQDQRVVRPALTSLPHAIEQIRQEAEQLERSVTTNQTFDVLTEKLQTQPEVRVVVTLRTIFNIDAEVSGTLVGRAQRSEIRRLRDQFINTAVGYDPSSLKTYESLPFVALSVNTTGLAWLQSSTTVLGIEEDRLHQPGMAESLVLVQADQAWAAGYQGTGQTVAVLDTGVDKNHGMLTGKVVSEACYSTNYVPHGATSLCPGGASNSTANNSALPCASGCAHGTHVAGTVAGNAVPFGAKTLSGVARDARLIAIQVFTRFTSPSICDPDTTCLRAYTSDILSGLNRVYELRNTYSIAAANLSLGGGQYNSEASCDSANSSYKTAIDLLRAANIASVISSGNAGYNGSLSAPACISTAVSVGATSDTTTEIASFSNTAPFLKLLAPGMSITSATPSGGYGTWNGTSMAAPHVAGAWAVLRQRATSATVPALLNALQTSGQALTDGRNGLSFRRIRVFDALQLVTTLLPSAPTALAATAFSPTQINLSWTDNSSNETSFKLERKIGLGGSWSLRATLAPNTTTYSDTGLSSETTYYYRLSAENGVGTSAWTNEANATTLPNLPAAPSSLTATAFSSAQINLSWTDNATNEASFKVERKLGAGGVWSVLATVGANVTVYSDTELAAGTYFYRVSAGNSAGTSAASNEASATTLAAPGAGTTRESLTQNRTYFVSPSGSDSNSGLTAGASFGSLQYAFNLIESTLDLKGSTVMIRASPGTYTSGITFRNWTGGGQIILDLGGATVSATGTNAVSTMGVLGGTLRIQNGTLRTTSAGNALSHGAAGTLIIDSGINFGPTAANHINIQSPGSLVVVLGSYTISGGAVNHIVANGSGTIFRHIRGTVSIDSGGAVIPFSSYFAYAGFGGFIYSGATYEIVSGSVSGIRYISFLNSIIYSTRGPSHFPGTIAGSAISGGQYQ
jgi:subtilisin family serine protease